MEFLSFMELFFIDKYSEGQKKITLSIEESRHVYKVLRKKTTDTIQVTDGKGTLVLTTIAGEQNRQLTLAVQEFRKFPFPSENEIELGISVVRPNRMDWAIEKATELGVKKIVPLYCHHSSYRNFKLDHVKRIAISAIKQSAQVYLPEISDPMSLNEWMESPAELPIHCFIATPASEGIWAGKSSDKTIRKYQLLIGPEGGFHSKELENTRKHSFKPLHLGPTILRTETAAIAGIIFLKSCMYKSTLDE
jgi:16S rRNA (uracil1498-N3)-methyltransferase